MKNFTTVEEQVEYGLDSVDPARKVEVSLRDLLFVNAVLWEFIRFFHQPLHYPNLAAVERFMGNYEEGGFHLLSQCYYEKMRDVWPENVQEQFDESAFDHPGSPYYYEATDES